MKNFINLDKNTSSRLEVLQLKCIETISVNMVEVNCRNENQQYIFIMLPKYVGKLLTKDLINEKD